jgi:sulfate permease, SulP family
VVGQVFFASADKFVEFFDFKEAVDKVVIDLCQAHFWDITSVSALDKVVLKFRREGTDGRDHRPQRGQRHHRRPLRVHDKPDAVDRLMGH